MSFKPFNPFAPPPRPQQQGKRPQSTDPRKEQRRKITRFLFNPELGAGFQDMRQTHGLFLRLVCNIFLQIGLIDAAYPGIADDKQLKFVTLILYAYHNLEYTREGMPRVLMFYSFLASIAAMGLAILLFALHLTSGSSHPVQHAIPVKH